MATYEIESTLEINTPYSVTAQTIDGPFVLAEFLENWSASVSHQVTSPFVFAEMVETFQGVVTESWVRTARAELVERFTASAMAYLSLQSVSNVVGVITSTMTARLTTPNKELLLSDVARAVYALWGFDGITDLRSISVGRERIVEWCNAAMQLIYSRADKLEYFNSETLTATVPALGYVALPSTVQRIQGEARIAGRSLRPLASKAQVDDFAAYYPGATTPLAFYVDTSRTAETDSLAMVLYLAPAPSGNTDVVLDVTNEPPRWDVNDILGGAIIPLPHKWVETIFMPLVRKWACSDSAMPAPSRQAQSKEIDEQYAAARQMLGLADVEPAAVKDGKGGRSDA